MSRISVNDKIKTLQERLECKRNKYIERKNSIGKIDLNDKELNRITNEIDSIQCEIYKLKNNKS